MAGGPETGELGTGRLRRQGTDIIETREREELRLPKQNKARAFMIAFGAGVAILVAAGLLIVLALGPAGAARTTAPSADAAAQRKILEEKAKAAGQTLRDKPLDQSSQEWQTERETRELTPEQIEARAAEAQLNRREGNLLIGGILDQAEQSRAGFRPEPEPAPLPAGAGAAPPAVERSNRSLYRGVDYNNPAAKEQAANRQEDYAKERQTMFAYSRSMPQAGFFDKKEPAGDPGPAPSGEGKAKTGPAAAGRPPAAEPAEASAIARLKEKFGRGNEAKPQGPAAARAAAPPAQGTVRLFAGEFLDAVLQNRIVADTAPSPVVAYVNKDHYDRTGQWVVFPTGTRLIGFSQAVDYMGAARLFIRFDRMVRPDGQLVYFPDGRKAALALDRTGALGVASKVNRHWLLQFGTALVVGVLDGLGAAAQQHTDPYSGQAYVIEDTTDNFEKILNTIMQRYSNIVPTITVNAGKKMKIFLADDLELAPFARTAERSYARR